MFDLQPPRHISTLRILALGLSLGEGGGIGHFPNPYGARLLVPEEYDL
jgi:hypothetical protein